MSGKLLIFLGLVLTALFIYICIDAKKDALYAQEIEKNEPTIVAAVVIPKEIKEEVIKQPIPLVKPKKEASFAYATGEKDKIAGILSKQDKESEITTIIEDICQKENCIKELKFVAEVKPFNFTKETLGLISYAKKEEIKDFSLYIDKKSLKLKGEVQNQEQLESVIPFFETFLDSNYTIENEMKIEIPKPVVQKEPIPEVKEKIIKEEIIVEAPRDVFVTPMHLSIEEASTAINNIMSANNITFDYKSSDITDKSKKQLDEVIDILLGLDDVSIQVAGYTDSKGGAVYNKVLSQKRADSVRTYLIKSGVRSKLIKSKGYGEENFISTPEDIINRRVEIHLKEEE